MTFLRRIFKRSAIPFQPARVDPKVIRAHFENAAGDEEHFPATIDPRILHVRMILDELGDLNGRTIADVGCGKGRFARIVKERYPECNVIALDLAEAMLAYAPRELHRIAATMTALPLADESVDAAYATESLEHAQDIELAVAELVRTVKPGGRIIIIDKNAEAWGRLETPAWERWFTAKDLERLLRKGCSQVSSCPLAYWDDVEPDGLFLIWVAVKSL